MGSLSMSRRVGLVVVGAALWGSAARAQAPAGVAWSSVPGSEAWTAAARAAVVERGRSLWTADPTDIDSFCPAYRNNPEESRQAFWVGLLSIVARYESDFKPSATSVEPTIPDRAGRPVVDHGLLQISIESANGNYQCRLEKPEDLDDPTTNLRCGVSILARLVGRDHVIARRAPGPRARWLGGAAYWKTLRTEGHQQAITDWTTRRPYCVVSLAPAVSGSAYEPAPEAMAPSETRATTVPPAPPHLAEAGTAKASTVRYVTTDRSQWPSTPNNFPLKDVYTRVFIQTLDTTAGSLSDGSGRPDRMDYDAQRRPALIRLFFGRTQTITAVANIDVSSPALKTTAPLFSISHTSEPGVGESFVSNFMSSSVESPLFRVDPTTSLSIHLGSKLSDDTKSQAFASTLSVVQQALKIASPQSAVLTTLSSAEINNATQALDKVVSGLMSQSITEDIQLGAYLNTWTPSSRIVVDGAVPAKLLGSGAGADRSVGPWTISLTCPRLSLFDPRDICEGFPALEAVGAGWRWSGGASYYDDAYRAIALVTKDRAILSSFLSSQVSIEQYIKTENGFAALSQAEHKGDPETIAFCLSVSSDLYTAGLNDFDANLALRAAIRAMPALSAFRQALSKGCAPLLPAYMPL